MKSSMKPTSTEPGHQEQHEQPGRGDAAQEDDVRDEIAEQDRGDDDRAAHGRRAALGVVGGRAVVADQLAVALAP